MQFRWAVVGSDIEALVADGVPALSPRTVGAHYFDWHHTETDTLDKVDPVEFRRMRRCFRCGLCAGGYGWAVGGTEVLRRLSEVAVEKRIFSTARLTVRLWAASVEMTKHLLIRTSKKKPQVLRLRRSQKVRECLRSG